jgi:hypothetical protein
MVDKPRKAKLLLVSSAKGGGGKTTSARNLVVCALHAQGSLTLWFQRRPQKAPQSQHFQAPLADSATALDAVTGLADLEDIQRTHRSGLGLIEVRGSRRRLRPARRLELCSKRNGPGSGRVTTDLKKWAVSKGRSALLSKLPAETPAGDSQRFQTLSNSIRDLSSEADVVDEVGKLWREAQDKFLTIGRYLVRAKQRFRGSYEAMILPQLPFGKGVAYQLRAVAVAVDEGRLLEEEMPHSYATAYQLVSLPQSDFDLARKEHLVRPDVLRREVEAFRARVRSNSAGQRTILLRELNRLKAEVSRAQSRIAEIERGMAAQSPAGDTRHEPRKP